MQKTIDEGTRLQNTYASTNSNVDQFALVLSCLTEFIGIEQALSSQDEDDRKKIQLMGQGKAMRDPLAMDMTPDIDRSVFNTIGGGSSTKASGPLLTTARQRNLLTNKSKQHNTINASKG